MFNSKQISNCNGGIEIKVPDNLSNTQGEPVIAKTRINRYMTQKVQSNDSQVNANPGIIKVIDFYGSENMIKRKDTIAPDDFFSHDPLVNPNKINAKKGSIFMKKPLPLTADKDPQDNANIPFKKSPRSK